jgi:serine/threonine protein kinase
MPKNDRAAPPGEDDRADSVDSFLREAAAITDPPESELPAPALLEAGDLVGDRFLIGHLAGSGGMGAVYRARDLGAGAGNADVAIKVVAKQSGSGHQRFLREAAVLAELSHPAIVRYVARGTTPHGLPFLAMDWLEGEDLSQRLARSPLSLDESLTLVRRAAEGLAVAHARGVVHRDIKPSNLFLVGGEPERVKVIDFGIARVEVGAHALTRPGASLGTAGYMAPEQATEAADVDARADVYGLGCVLFECLTGQPPFRGRPASLLVKVLRDKPPRPSDLRAGLTADIDALVARLLAKDRSERPADASDLLRALEAVGAGRV